MTIESVIIQCDEDGEFENTALFSAWLGFEKRGRHVVRMTADEIAGITERKARPQHLVFGGVEVVRPYLAKLGVEPEPIDYPERLRPWLKRSLTTTTMGQVRRLYQEPAQCCFVKPVEHKEFNGGLVTRFGDLVSSAHVSSDARVYMVEYKPFITEWRFYVHQGTVKGVSHYYGEPLVFPDKKEVKRAAKAFSWKNPDAPAAYGLDFGVGEDGETRLVEANDMIALGNYGIDHWVYSWLIEKRWDQLVKPLLEAPEAGNTG